jgi:hypothetical protein
MRVPRKQHPFWINSVTTKTRWWVMRSWKGMCFFQWVWITAHTMIGRSCKVHNLQPSAESCEFTPFRRCIPVISDTKLLLVHTRRRYWKGFVDIIYLIFVENSKLKILYYYIIEYWVFRYGNIRNSKANFKFENKAVSSEAKLATFRTCGKLLRPRVVFLIFLLSTALFLSTHQNVKRVKYE